jgi:hypothetical protein
MGSILGGSLVDRLVPLADRLRRIPAGLGVRQWRVIVVRRRWSGARRGQGTPSFVSQLELDPRPLVRVPDAQIALHLEMELQGRQEAGLIDLVEVSLRYSEGDLTGGELAANEELYYRLIDGEGQGLLVRHYVLDGPPRPDREKTLGWVVHLRRAEKIEE